MKNRTNTEREVEKTLASLDGMERASTDDFFYSRLSAKLENREITHPGEKASLSYGFLFSAAAVFIVLMLNLISIVQFEPFNNTTEMDREAIVDQLASEYEVVDLNYYQTFEEE